MSEKTEYKLIMRLPSGHRIFEEFKPKFGTVPKKTDRIAIADNSGSTPDLTEDGVLYLDTSRNLYIGEASSGTYCSVPLMYPTGEPTGTLVDARTIALLANRFAWSVRIGDIGGFKQTS